MGDAGNAASTNAAPGGSSASSSGTPVNPDPSTSAESPTVAADANLAPRLTQVEFNQVLRDLLGDLTAPASVYLSEDEFSPFDNDATRQVISASLIDSLHALSEDVASRVAHDPTSRAVWMPCEPTGVNDEACFDAAVQQLGRAFFRRPFTTDEVESYRRLLPFAAEQGDFYVAIELLLSSLLQDPEFLYRLERERDPGASQLTDHEIATRLAFLLWGSTPDEALLTEADDGLLATSDGRRDAATRLLADPRAHQQLYRFHSMWLGYRTIPHDATLNAAFELETEKLIERVVFSEPQNYLHLFQSNETYLSGDLPAHYALPAPAGGEGWITYPEDSGRAGILSHGSVLSAFAKFSDTSPTQRGIFVRTRLLCLDVPPPPPAVNVDEPPGGVDAAGECKTDRYRAHREQSGCVDCHSLFEPIGMGLENFDRAGRFREHDDDNESCAITGEGTLPGVGSFSGPAELAQLLTENNLIQGCFVRHYLEYAQAKSKLSASDLEQVTELVTSFEDRGLKLDEWLLDFVSTETFGERRQELP